MKWTGLIWALFASGACADSLCGWTDEAAIRAALAGEWDQSSRVSTVTASGDFITPVAGTARISPQGQTTDGQFTAGFLPVLTPVLGETVYDVDQMDDLFDTTDTDWIADTVSLTPCGPSGLPQLSIAYVVGEDLSGRLTLIPYFTDQVVMVVEAEVRGDWGLAFVTSVGLLSRDD